MKRFVLILLAITVSGTGAGFAQEGFIKPAFIIGYLTGTGDLKELEGITLGVDVDFVHSSGLTLGISNWHINELQEDGGHSSSNMIGLGYTYAVDKWCLGGKFMVNLSSTALLGINANFNYWLSGNLGIGAIGNFLFSADDNEGSVISLAAGLSLKF